MTQDDPGSAVDTSIDRHIAEIGSDADRRTILSVDRTIFAAERTYAAWLRTGLAALASGVGARALLDRLVPDWFAMVAGGVLVLLSAFCFIAGVWREIIPVYTGAPPDVRRIPPALLVSVNGILVLVSIAAFVGLLTIR